MLLINKIKKLKIKEKIIVLKKDIKAKPLKYLTPIIFLIILDYPFKSYAEEIKGLEDTSPDTKVGKVRELGIAILGLKKCFDPTATQLEKAISCTRPCCLLAGLTTGYIAENSPVGTPIHKAASLCCASSWSAYAFLAFYDPKKDSTKKEL